MIEEYLKTIKELKGEAPKGFFYNSAEDFLLQNGKYYEYKPKPREIHYGEKQLCYMNAYRLASIGYTYVEGYAMSDNLPMPIQHAWVLDKDGKVIDNTWRKKWLDNPKYFGVAMPIRFVESIMLRTEVFGVFYPYDDLETWKMILGKKWSSDLTKDIK